MQIAVRSKSKAAYYASTFSIFYFLLTIAVEDLVSCELRPVSGWPAGVKPGSLLGAPEVIVYW